MQTDLGRDLGVPAPSLFTGSLAHSIAIEVPPGRNGLQPKISLSYNSTGGNGPLGVGWQLEPGHIAYTGYRRESGGAQHFVLHMPEGSTDLIPGDSNNPEDYFSDPAYGTGLYWYPKIQDQFFRVRWSYITDFRRCEMIGKDGTRYEFWAGEDNTEFVGPKILLRKVTDTHGNTIFYDYHNDQGRLYLDQIRYGGNDLGGMPTNRVIKFYYEARNDVSTQFVEGYIRRDYRVTTAKRLASIDVLVDGVRQRAYKLSYTYSPNTGRSILASVQQFGANAVLDATSGAILSGSKLPAQTFTSTKLANAFLSQTWGAVGTNPISDMNNWGPSERSWAADFNGNGKTDIASLKCAPSCTLRYWSSTGSLFADGLTVSDTDWGDADHTWLGDFDGDGAIDIATAIGGQIWMRSHKTRFVKALWATAASNWGDAKHTWVGDVNDDGNADIITASGSNIWVKRSTGSGFVEENGTSWASEWAADSSRIWSGDFDGDGRSDIATLVNSNTLRVYYANNYGFDLRGMTGNAGSNWGTAAYTRTGDFNGDGKTDIATASGGNIWVKLATGSNNGYAPEFVEQQWSSSVGNWGSDMVAADFNGDGLTDLASTNGSTLWLKRSTGAAFVEEAWATTSASNWNTQGYTWLGDFDGDGKTELASRTQPTATSIGIVVNAADKTPVDLIDGIANGLGGNTSIVYKSSTQYSNTQLPFALQTVSSTSACDNWNLASKVCAGNAATTTYLYGQGYYHVGAKDFRGFGWAAVTTATGFTNKTYFHQGNKSAYDILSSVYDAYLKGKPYYTESSSGGAVERAYTYYQPDLDGAPFFTPVSKIDRRTYASGLSSEAQYTGVNYQYDRYGNVTREENSGAVGPSGATGDPSDDYTIVKSYAINLDAGLVNRPATEVIYAGIGTASLLATSSYYYDGTDCNSAADSQVGPAGPVKGDLTCIKRWLNGGSDSMVKMQYDGYGNLTGNSDAKGNSSSIVYDSSQSFPVQTVNALGHITRSSYYGVDGVLADKGRYGQLKSVTDANGAVSRTQYDLFGRKAQIIKPMAGTVSYQYLSFGTPGLQNTKILNGTLWSQDYFDGLGRSVKTTRKGPDGKTIVSETQYDNRGLVKQTSLPYFQSTQTARWQIPSYDIRGRITSMTNPDGSKTLTCYARNDTTSTIDANGHKRREVRNSRGQLVEVNEYSGVYTACDTALGSPYATTRYQYDPLGNLKQVTDAQGNVTTLQYDSLGRKAAMHDPDMGDWIYEYDANGNMSAQRDAKNQWTHFQYDALNRLVQKDYNSQKALGSGDVVYRYDEATSTYSKGRLSSVRDPSGSTQFFYDAEGHTSRAIKTVDAKAYTTQTAYDTMGRVKGITYPDNSSVAYTYDTGGNLLSVGGNMAQYTNYNAAGQAGLITYGNGVTSTQQYDPNNFRQTSLATLSPNSVNYQVSSTPLAWNPSASTDAAITLDNQNKAITLAAPFTFYGKAYTSVSISSEGYLQFGTATAADSTPDSAIPNVATPNAIIAGLWRSMNPAAGGCTDPSGLASPCITYSNTSSQLVVSYNNIKNYANTNRQRFQIILNSDGSIVLQYNNISNDVPTTVGVENARGSVGTAASSPVSGTAIQFTPQTLDTTLQNLTYGYDAGGNVKAINNPQQGNQSFNYDELGRLIDATGPYGPSNAVATLNYAYDQIGNMRCNSQISPCNATAPNYTYNPSGPASIRPHAAIQAGPNSYAYDNNGNMTSGAGRTITYDSENRPINIIANSQSVTFNYDGDGGRVKKTANGITTIYIGKLYECVGSTCTKYYFAGSQRIAMKSGSQTLYYHSDHLGSSSVITDQAGNGVQTLAYFPYGATRLNSGSVDVHHQYTGQELDAETGLYFYNARYYDPVLGRFMQADTLIPGLADPQAFNRYSYVRNNPIFYIDPSGHSWFSSAWHRAEDWVADNPQGVFIIDIVITAVACIAAPGSPVCYAAAVNLMDGATRESNKTDNDPSNDGRGLFNKWDDWSLEIGGNTDGSNVRVSLRLNDPRYRHLRIPLWNFDADDYSDPGIINTLMPGSSAKSSKEPGLLQNTRSLCVTCVAQIDKDTRYDKNGYKWCTYDCDGVDIMAPANPRSEFTAQTCYGAYGGTSRFDTPKVSPIEINRNSWWDKYWYEYLYREVDKTFGWSR